MAVIDCLKCAHIEGFTELQVLKRVLVGSLQERVLKDRRALRLGKRVPAVHAELLTTPRRMNSRMVSQMSS